MTALLFGLGLNWLAISLREWVMTVISDSLEHVFVHLHKCGGTSIEKAYIDRGHRLDTVLGGDETGEALNLIWGRRFELHKHSTAQHLGQCSKEGLGNLLDFFLSFGTPKRSTSLSTGG